MPKDVQVHVFYIQIYCYEEVGMIHMIIFFFFNLKNNLDYSLFFLLLLLYILLKYLNEV